MKILNLLQGSEEWIADRMKYSTASEASMVMGVHANVKRNGLLHMKATGTKQEFDGFMKKIVDNGHVVEALARPIAEDVIGSDLYPITGIDDEGVLLASFDGRTSGLDGSFSDESEVIWECKSWNESKALIVRGGKCPEGDYWQVIQQLIVSRASKCLYMVTDGTPEKTVQVWVALSNDAEERLKAGWSQFNKDLIEYVPTEDREKAKSDLVRDLVSIDYKMNGMALTSNFDIFKRQAVELIEKSRQPLVTDNDFATAERLVTIFRGAESKLTDISSKVVAEAVDINAFVTEVGLIKEHLRQARLSTDKLIKSEKVRIKDSLASVAEKKYREHLIALEEEIAPIRLGVPIPDFLGSMGGKRNSESLNEAVDTLLANSKIDVDLLATKFRKNLAYKRDNDKGFSFLFNDLQQIINNEYEAFTAIVSNRVTQHELAEQKRLDEQREAIRIEEESKAKKIIDDEAARVESVRVAEVAKQANIDAARKKAISDAEQDQIAMPVVATDEKVNAIKHAATTGKSVTAPVKKAVTPQSIANYLTDEGFPQEHLNALQTIVSKFNESEQSEKEIFAFALHLKNKYGVKAA